MITITIHIPNNKTDEALDELKSLGVKIRQSRLSKLDKLIEEDYEKHFTYRAKATRNNVLRYL